MKNLTENQKKGYKLGKIAAMVEYIHARTGNRFGHLPEGFEGKKNLQLLQAPFLNCGVHALLPYSTMPGYKESQATLLWSISAEDFEYDLQEDGWQSFKVAFRKDRAELRTDRYLLGLKIHRLRMVRNVSVKAVARWAGVTENCIRAIERGAYAAKVDQISKILGALDYTFADLIISPDLEKYDIEQDFAMNRAVEEAKKNIVFRKRRLK